MKDDFSDRRRFTLVTEPEKIAYFEEIAAKPGGLAFLGRMGAIVRAPDGRFYWDIELVPLPFVVATKPKRVRRNRAKDRGAKTKRENTRASVDRIAEDPPSHLKVIKGDRPAGKQRAGGRRSLQESEQATCWRCLSVRGIETSATVDVTVAPRRRPNRRIVGGTKIAACVYCLAEGEIVELGTR